MSTEDYHRGAAAIAHVKGDMNAMTHHHNQLRQIQHQQAMQRSGSPSTSVPMSGGHSSKGQWVFLSILFAIFPGLPIAAVLIVAFLGWLKGLT